MISSDNRGPKRRNLFTISLPEVMTAVEHADALQKGLYKVGILQIIP